VLETRPDLLKAKMDLKAQNYMVSNAIGQQFPTISLTGALGLASNTLNTLTTNPTAWNIGTGLFGPIFEFGKNRKRKQIEQEKTKQLLFVYEEKTINAFREIENQLSAINSLKKQLIAVERYKEAAVEAEMLSELRYDKGVTSYLEVLQNQKSALESQIQYSETKQKLLSSYVALYKSLGGGYITPEEYKNDLK
jgi:outer membrane protein, multidrug efflux system